MKILILLCFIVITFSSNAQTPNGRLEINHLTNNFYIFTTYNSFKGNPFPANGMYLITEKGAIMFDTPWDSTQFQPLLDSIEKRHQKKVIMCISTHSHEDRTAGLEYYYQQGIKTYTTSKTDSISIKKNEKRAKYLIHRDTTFSIGNYAFQTYYGGEGHTTDNIVIWFDKEKILYGGCMIKSTDSRDLGNIADANVEAWFHSLQKIEKKFSKPKFVIPGHQSWTNKKALSHTKKLIIKHLKKK